MDAVGASHFPESGKTAPDPKASERLRLLCLQLAATEDLLAAIRTAATRGSSHQLDYDLAVGEWLHCRIEWNLNEFGGTHADVDRAVYEALSPTRWLPKNALPPEDELPTRYSCPGFNRAIAIEDLRSRVADHDGAGGCHELPGAVESALAAAWAIAPYDAPSDEVFPQLVGQLPTHPLSQRLDDVLNLLKPAREQLVARLAAWGIETPGVAHIFNSRRCDESTNTHCEKEIPTKAAAIAEFAATVPKAPQEEPGVFGQLEQLGSLLVECLFAEAAASWEVRYRLRPEQWEVAWGSGGPGVVVEAINNLGAAGLRLVGGLGFGLDVGDIIHEFVNVAYDLATWNFFQNEPHTQNPTFAAYQKRQEEKREADRLRSYHDEKWHPLLGRFNTCRALVEGKFNAAKGDTPPRPRGRLPEKTTTLSVKKHIIHCYTKGTKDPATVFGLVDAAAHGLSVEDVARMIRSHRRGQQPSRQKGKSARTNRP